MLRALADEQAHLYEQTLLMSACYCHAGKKKHTTNYRIIILIQKEKLYIMILHIYTKRVSSYMKYKDSQS